MRPTRGLGRTLKGLAGTLLTPAENPRQTISSETGLLQERIERVREARAKVAITQQRLERRLSLSDDGRDALTSRAREALIAGREDLARLALQQRRSADSEHQALTTQLEAMAAEGERLTLVEQRLVARLDAWTARREILAARLTAAEIQAGVEASLTGAAADLSNVDAAMSQTEDALQYLHARSTAIDHLTKIGVLDSLDRMMLPAHDSEIDADLAALRASIT